MYITLYDFGLFILISITVIISVYLIAVLRQALFLFIQAREIFAAHGNDIRETLSLLPAVLVNINLLCINLTETAGQTNRAFQSLQTDMVDTVDDLQDGIATFIIYAKVIGEIFKSLFSKIV